jgi:hypothetical protein
MNGRWRAGPRQPQAGQASSKGGVINQYAYVAGSTDRAALRRFGTVPNDARAKANLVAAMAVAELSADEQGGSFADLKSSRSTVR